MYINYAFILLSFLVNEAVNVAINVTDDKTVGESSTGIEFTESTTKESINIEIHNDQISNFDDNYQLRKLHSTPTAGIFLEGCINMYSAVSFFREAITFYFALSDTQERIEILKIV